MKIKFNNLINKVIAFYPFIFFFMIVLYAIRKVLFKDDNILYGEFFGTRDYIFFLKNYLTAWNNSNFGHPNIGLTTNYELNNPFWIIPPGYDLPFLFILSIFQLIFGIFTMKIYLLLALILPFLGMFFLAKYWFNKLIFSSFVLNSLSYISALIYGVNAVMGDRITAGHLKYNLGHGLFALLFLFTFKSIDTKNDKTKKLNLGLSGLIIGFLVWLMPHLLSLYIIVMGLYFILFVIKDKKKVIKFFVTVFFIGLIGLFLNIHIWLPSLLFKQDFSYVTDPTYHSGYLYNLSRGIKINDLLTLTSGFEKIFYNKKAYDKLIILKYILPILAIIGSVVNKQRKKTFFLLLIGLTGLIFSMGINYPFEKIYNFLYENIFLFKSFREPAKFIILYLLSLSLLLPYVFLNILRYINKAVIFLSIIFFTFLILYINPNYTSGNFSSAIDPFTLPNEYYQLNNFLSKSKENFRVTIYPNDTRIGDYNWYPKTSMPSAYYRIFNSLLPLRKNLVVSNRAMWDWTSRYLDYLEANLDKSWAVQRLGQGNVKYLVVDHNVNGYEKTLSLLSYNPQVKKLQNIGNFSIFEINNYNRDPIYKSPATYYFGDVRGLSNLPANVTLINLGLTAHKIPSEDFSLSNNIIFYNTSPQELFYASLQDFSFSFFPEARFPKDMAKNFFFPAEYLRLSLTSKGIIFYNPEIIQTGGISSIEKNGLLKTGKYKILLSVFTFDDQNNKIRITINSQKISRNSYKTQAPLQWIDFGNVSIDQKKSKIKLENLTNKPLLVDYLILVPENIYKKRAFDFYSKIKSKNIILLKENQFINFNEIAKYTKPISVLTQAYSSLWNYCRSKPFRVNFYATGFNCKPKNANYAPYYEPSFIYAISLIFSLVFYLSLSWYIIKNSKKTK